MLLEKIFTDAGNVLSRIEPSNYSCLLGGINSPSLAILKRILSQCTLHLVHTGEGAIFKISSCFDTYTDMKRTVILQHHGIRIRCGVVWTKDNCFLGLVPARKSFAHALLVITESPNIELA